MSDYDLINEIRKVVDKIKSKGLQPKRIFIDEKELRLAISKMPLVPSSDARTICGVPFVFDDKVMPIAPFVILDEEGQHYYGGKTP